MTNSNRKCGEITFCSQVGKRVYALNCLYCPQICLQWEMFINHLEQEHAKYLTLDYIVQPETSKTPIKMEVHEVVTEECVAQLNNKKRKLEESILSDDPLESENSTSEICMESSIKIEQEEECPPNLNLFETEENSSEMDGRCDQRRRKATVRYREKIRSDPLRYKEYCNKAAERMRRHREKLSQLAKTNADLLQEKREKDRIRQKKLRDRKKLIAKTNNNMLKERREKDRLRQRRLRERKKNNAKDEVKCESNTCDQTLITAIKEEQNY